MKKKIVTVLLAAGLLAGFCGCLKQPATPTWAEPTPGPTEIAAQYRWDLSPLFADAEGFQQALQTALQDLIPALSAFEGKLNTAENILAFMQQKDGVDQALEQLSGYAELLTDQNQEDNTATALLQQVHKAMRHHSETIAFYGPELLANSNEFLDALLEREEMKPFVTQIHRLRQEAAHILPEGTEVLLLPLSSAAKGAYLLFSKLASADVIFPTIKDPGGNDLVNDESTWSMIVMGHPDRGFRKKSTEALLSAYGQYRNTLAQNMDNFVQATVSLAHSHNYATAKEAALAASAVPTVVYDNLTAAAGSNLDAVHRYVALRKELLGVDTFYTSDLYYPLVDQLEVSIPYEDAKKQIIEALAPLGNAYRSTLQKAFDGGWIDVYPSKGKSSGAFSSGIYGVHPYVMLNYTDDFYSVTTFAHELGHMVHQYESAKNQKSAFNSSPTSFTSEVASTTNELLLSDYMIKNAKSDQEKLFYLFSQLTTLHNTFFIQAMFSEFEDAMYQIVEGGGSLNAEVLESLWMQMIGTYYGPDCALVDNVQYGWSRVPHFYDQYYVYQYATSIAAACTISERIIAGEAGALEAYLAFLRSGDSDDGPALLQIAGVDITAPTLADALIARYNNLMEQIKALTRAD